MYFLIKETLQKCSKNEIKNCEDKYIAVLTSAEWKAEKDIFGFGIDLDLETSEILSTSADVNYDSLTGTFCVPNRQCLFEEQKFAFALDENGIVFIDDSGVVERITQNIKKTRRWRFPSLERFIYDFLDQIIKDDLHLMNNYERELSMMEHTIMTEDILDPNRVNDMRGDIRDLKNHYEQLLDLGQIFEENENNFFKEENIRYFHLFLNRIERLRDISSSIRDYTVQIQDFYKSHLDIKQNRIITVLTVITSIFMPLNLITGWFGMNFKYTSDMDWGYPLVIISSILIVIVCFCVFKKKKWL